MSYLLDTHLLLWLAEGSSSLPAAVRRMADENADASASVVNLWEIAIKHALGDRPADPVRVSALGMSSHLAGLAMRCIPVLLYHIHALERLPDLHRDPFDRLLIAQAAAQGLVLLTAEERLGAYGPMVRVV